MTYKPSRIALTFCLLFVLAFVGVNVLLNYTPLRENIITTLEDDTETQVKVGYLFLNWKLQPVLQSMTIESPNSADARRKIQRTELDQIILSLNWGMFWENPTAPLERYVDRIRIRTLRRRDHLTTGKQSGVQLDLPIPVHIGAWEVLFFHNQREVLQVAGENLDYEGSDTPLRSDLREYQHQPADGTLRLSLAREGVSGVANIRSMSFSDDIWELQDDRWSGTIRIGSEVDHTRLDVNLNGTPGRMGGRQLPEITVSSAVEFDTDQYNVRSLRIDSKYLQSRASGFIDPSRNKISLDGEYTIPLPEFFGGGISRRFHWIRNVSASAVEGSFGVEGSLGDPDLFGKMTLPPTQFTLDTSGGTSSADVRNFEAQISDDRLQILSGELREGTKVFQLNTGFLEIEKGQVTVSASGPLTMDPARSLESSFYPGPGRSIRKLRDVDVILSITSTFSPGSRETALAVKDGSFHFGPGRFRDVRGVLSHSSAVREDNTLEASLRDPDGNEWRLSGPVRGPYELQGSPTALNGWLNYLFPNFPLDQPVTLKNTPVRATVRSMNTVSDNRFELRTDDNAQITVNGRELSLAGRIRGDSAGVHFRSLEASTKRGRLNVEGTLVPDTVFEQSSLDIRLESEFFPVTSWLQPHYKSLSRARLSGQVNLSGTVRSPDPQGSFRFDELKYGFLRFTDLNANVAREADTIILSGIAGTLNNGQVRGRMQLGETNRLQLEGSVVAVDLSKLFPVGSWANRHVGGSLTGDVDLRGRLRDPDSYNGQVTGKVRGLVFDYFPRIEGIEKVARPKILKNPILIEPSEFSFPIRDGDLQVNDVNLKADGLRLKTEGKVRFKGNLNLSMKLVLLDEAMKGFIQDVLGDLYRRVGIGGDGKKLTIPLRVQGPIESPNISVNHSEVNTNFRKNVVESLLSRPVGKPVNELLDEILRTN